MAQAAKDVNASVVSCSENQLKLFTNSFTIGAAGAVDSTQAGYRTAPGCSLVRTGTGTYTLTYPICPNCIIDPTLTSGAATVTEAICTAKTPTSGTATIRTSKAGTATDPASGEIVEVIIFTIPVGPTN